MPEDVQISRSATPANRPLQVTTRNLRYRPAEGYAETDEAVTVTSNQDRIDAVGLQAWLLEPARMRFRSQVRGHYEP
jgi:lipopolysaccharide export system protein LptC